MPFTSAFYKDLNQRLQSKGLVSKFGPQDEIDGKGASSSGKVDVQDEPLSDPARGNPEAAKDDA